MVSAKKKSTQEMENISMVLDLLRSGLLKFNQKFQKKSSPNDLNKEAIA